MKQLKAYAVVDRNGRIDMWDSQVPIYWLRRIAERAKREHCPDGEVVCVTVELAAKERRSK